MLISKKTAALRTLQTLSLIAAAAWLAWYTTGPQLEARWGIIDDHWIAHLLGPDRTLSLREIPERLGEMEIGSPGATSRYRPAYCVMQVLEAFIWGDNPGHWYAFRTFIWFACLFGLALSCWVLIGYLAIFPIMGWVVSVGFWYGIFGRLGPGEIYGALGLSLYLPSLIYLWRHRHAESSAILINSVWVAFAVGNFLLIGSKENWLILILPNFLFGLSYLRRYPREKAAWGALGFSGLMILWVGVSIYAGLKSVGHVYADLSAASTQKLDGARLSAYGESFFNEVKSAWLPLGAAFLLAVFIIYRGRAPEALRIISHALIGIAVFAVFYIWHLYFYNGSWAGLPRYAFPGDLVRPTLVVFALFLLQEALRGIFKKQGPSAVIIPALAFLIASPYFIWGELVNLRYVTAKNAGYTQLFTRYIERAAEYAARHPRAVLIIEASGAGVEIEYEPVISLARFLSFYGLGDRIFLRLHPPIDPPVVPAFQRDLQALSQTGHLEGSTQVAIRPISELPERKRQVSLEVTPLPSFHSRTLGRVPLY